MFNQIVQGKLKLLAQMNSEEDTLKFINLYLRVDLKKIKKRFENSGYTQLIRYLAEILNINDEYLDIGKLKVYFFYQYILPEILTIIKKTKHPKTKGNRILKTFRIYLYAL